jgi:protein-L-isoaspartate(D-aspartate) O-methyltransferase
MVKKQIAARGISDKRVLAAMQKVERHRFVAEELRRHAYGDYPLPIEAGQTISQPYIVALMTELADVSAKDTVLEIGTGSGYQAAVLGELAAHVYTIEIVDTLAATARRRLESLGYDNVTVKAGDGYQGWPEHAPFDAIVVTAAPENIPQPLIDQLADGGKLVIPVGTSSQDLVLVEKKEGKITQRSITPVIFVPMTGEGVKPDK